MMPSMSVFSLVFTRPLLDLTVENRGMILMKTELSSSAYFFNIRLLGIDSFIWTPIVRIHNFLVYKRDLREIRIFQYGQTI